MPIKAQNVTSRPTYCFAIHVRLNGNPIAGPQVITLKTRDKGKELMLENGCFTVPASVLTQDVVDVLFTVPGSKIDLVGIKTGFLAGPWDIDLADKKFIGDVVFPKHTRAKEVCAVVFHDGSEPERALSQTKCRTPAP
jgi:hypothetical protein